MTASRISLSSKILPGVIPLAAMAVFVLGLAGPAYAPWCEYTALKHFQAGNELLGKGEVKGAVNEYHEALKANTQFAGSLFDQALADYKNKIESQDGNGALYYRMGVLYFSRSEYAKAWEYAKTAKEKGYEVQPAFFNMIKEEAPWIEGKGNGLQ